MDRQDFTVTDPDFQKLLERSDQVSATIRQLLSDPKVRDLKKLSKLNLEAVQIAEKMERVLQQRSPSSSASASFQHPVSTILKNAGSDMPNPRPARSGTP